jgi:hypothetical protein
VMPAQYAGLRWALCLAAATHAYGFKAPMEDYGQRRMVLTFARHLLMARGAT